MRSVDPFDTLVIHRIDRAHWQATPQQSGVYLLYGVAPDGKLTVYIGMSAANMRNRIRSHHVDKKTNWFGVLFAIPVPNALLCPAIEAQLIAEVAEAGIVDVIANAAEERRHRDADDVHVEPAVEKIREGLELVLGSDIFTAPEVGEAAAIDAPLTRLMPLAREYRGRAAVPRKRVREDPADATHAYVGAGGGAWGRFEAAEPDKRFRVLAGGGWRRAALNPSAKTYEALVRVAAMQDSLVAAGLLDEATMTFAQDHVFENWGLATQAIAGTGRFSGAYNWQLLEGDSAGC